MPCERTQISTPFGFHVWRAPRSWRPGSIRRSQCRGSRSRRTCVRGVSRGPQCIAPASRCGRARPAGARARPRRSPMSQRHGSGRPTSSEQRAAKPNARHESCARCNCRYAGCIAGAEAWRRTRVGMRAFAPLDERVLVAVQGLAPACARRATPVAGSPAGRRRAAADP